MLKIYDKSEDYINELYRIIETSEDKEQKNLYSYKLFLLLSYLDRHNEALEVSKNINDSNLNKVILLYLIYVDNELERVYKNSNIVNDLEIELIDNHHRYLVLFMRAMYYNNKEDYQSSAELLVKLIKTCESDEILVEIAIIELLEVVKKCKDKESFYDFYATYYTGNKEKLSSKLISQIEQANNNVGNSSFGIDEVLDLYTNYIDGSISFREFFYSASKELEKIVPFDVAYLFIKNKDNVDTYEYKKDLVFDRYYRLYEITGSIYNEIMNTKEPIVKKLGDTSINRDIVLFKNNKDTYDSFLSLPIINNDELIAAFSVSANSHDINDYTEVLQRFTNLLKIKIITMLNNHTANINEQIVAVLDDLTDGYIFESKGKINLSKRAREIFDIEEAEVHISEIVNMVKPIHVTNMQNAISRLEEKVSFEIETNSNKTVKISSSSINIKNRDSIRISVLNDLTKNKNQLVHYENLAYVDSLTKLPNYNSLMNAFRKIIPGKDVTFINFDIDKFKLVNDTYGHDVGDAALIFFAEALTKVFEDINGQVFRKSGDEFIVILDDAVVREQKITALRNLSRYLNDQNNYTDKLPVKLNYSAGVASTRITKGDKNTLFKFADLAMYDAKTNGKKRRYVFFDKVHLRRYQLGLERVQHIREAIKHDIIQVTYKDIICTDKSIHAYSVNIGIPNIEMFNQDIVELAMKNELLYKLETLIIKRVFSEQRAFINQTHQERNVHIPVTADNLATDVFYEFVRKITTEYNISADTITFVVRNLHNTGNLLKYAEQLNMYVNDGYNLSFDFKFTEYPNTSYFHLVDFKYYSVPGIMLEALKDGNHDKKQMYENAIFLALNKLNVEPIIDDIDINKEFKTLKENNIRYFTQIGRNDNKILKEVILEVREKGTKND